MSERILIPLDDSKLGEVSLHYVEKLASRLAPSKKVEVTLFHVVSAGRHLTGIGGEDAYIRYTEEDIGEKIKRAMDYLEKAGEGLRKRGSIVNCKVAVAEANINPAEEIIRAEEETNADLVAMSTHGRHGLSRWAFGSVTDKVLRSGKVPVLMVRAPGETK